jgi:hypothetical protein
MTTLEKISITLKFLGFMLTILNFISLYFYDAFVSWLVTVTIFSFMAGILLEPRNNY